MVGRCTASVIASASRKSFFCPFDNRQMAIMRRSAGPAQKTHTLLLFVAVFALHYFPANLCGHSTSRGVIYVEI
jgi:hypothetical protein